jgi:glycosyltransferase involved in cell wall biosynthesis
MKIVVAHNRYVYRGGEDTVFDRECQLLRTRGHEVVEYTKDNRTIAQSGKLALAFSTVWASDSFGEFSRLLESVKPDVIHVHNTLPLISPAVYYAAARFRIPVVQTLHNYRLLCPNGLLQREGAVCELCVHKAIPWPAVRHACYRADRSASLALTASLAIHRAAGTWRRKVTTYIALSDFSKRKLIAAGLPENRIFVKANFALDSYGPEPTKGPRSGALFVGRLSQEKGVEILLQAWRDLQVDLIVTSDGPLAEMMRRESSGRIKVLGYVTDEALAAHMCGAAFLIMPSLVYEGFPMVVAEAFAAGLPIIASRLGALEELVKDGVTGLHFQPGDPRDLAAKVRWASENKDRMREMGRNARKIYEEKYTPDRNYFQLMEIYEEARTRTKDQVAPVNKELLEETRSGF